MLSPYGIHTAVPATSGHTTDRKMITTNHIQHTMDSDDSISINESIYRKLTLLIPDFEERIGTPCKRTSHVTDRRDLHYRYTGKDIAGNHIMSLSHEHIDADNLDTVPDPEIAMLVIPEMGIAEALSYQDQFVYKEVHQMHEGEPFVHYKLLGELNKHLDAWLSRLIVYGHSIDLGEERERAHEPRGRRAIARSHDHSPETDLSR